MIRIEGGLVFDGDGFVEATLVVDGDRIAYVGPEAGAPVADERILADGMAVLPGLINCHTHLAMNLLRGYADDMALMPWLQTAIWPVEDRMNAEDVRLGTELALLELIRTGTTTFNDMYMFQEEVAAATIRSGMRGVLGRGLIGANDGARRILAEAVALFRTYDGAADGRLHVFLAPHAVYTCPNDYLTEVAHTAAQLGTVVHTHVAETREEVERCVAQQGTTPLGLLQRLGFSDVPVVAAHMVWTDEADVERAAMMNVSAAHCPVSNFRLGCGMAPISALRAQGVAVGLATDGAASANTLDLFAQMRAAAYAAKVRTLDPTELPALEILRMATSDAARTLHLADIGTLRSGAKADLILVNLDAPHLWPGHAPASTLTSSASGLDVDSAMVDGVWLMRKHAFLTLDAERIQAEVRRRLPQLIGRGPTTETS